MSLSRFLDFICIGAVTTVISMTVALPLYASQAGDMRVWMMDNTTGLILLVLFAMATICVTGACYAHLRRIKAAQTRSKPRPDSVQTLSNTGPDVVIKA
jgi:fructose-specific phosphotransferase system IIC component